MWQIPSSLPAVDFVVEEFLAETRGRKSEQKPFGDYVLFGAQHLLSSQAPLFSAFEKLGIEAKDIHLLGVPYSSSDLMGWYFRRQGYEVRLGRSGEMDDLNGQHRLHDQRLEEIEHYLEEVVAQAEKTGKRVLVLDDGGLVSSIVAKKYPDKARLFKFVEQTTRGNHRGRGGRRGSRRRSTSRARRARSWSRRSSRARRCRRSSRSSPRWVSPIPPV